MMDYIIPARTTNSGGQTPAVLVEAQPDLKRKVEPLVNWMKKNRNVKSLEYWPLNQKTCADWRDPGKRNHGRDYTKFAHFALLEIDAVNKYRSQLLEKSDAAAYLRHAFQESLKPFCMDRVVKFVDGKKVKVKTVKGWAYPDLIVLRADRERIAKPSVNVAELAATREKNAAEVEGRRTLKGFLMKAQALPIFAAAPDTSLLDDTIRNLLDKLEYVRLFTLCL